MSQASAKTSWEQGGGFSRRTVFWIVVTAVVSFIVALLLMAFGPDMTEGMAAEPSTFSYSALGHRALTTFLQESGLPVTIQRSRQLFQGDQNVPVFVAEPNPYDVDLNLDEYLQTLIDNASRRSTPLILVLPKWRGTSYQTARGLWVDQVSLINQMSVEKVLNSSMGTNPDAVQLIRESSNFTYQSLSCQTEWGETLKVNLIAPQLLAPSITQEPIVWSTDGILVSHLRTSRPENPLYVISDPDILNNHGLAREDNAIVTFRLLVDILGAQAVVFDEIVHGYGRELSFLAETVHYPMILAVLHGVLVFVLLLWAGMGRFGKPQPNAPRQARGKLGLIENTSSLLSYQGRVLDSSIRYFDTTLLDVARHYHLPGELTKEELHVRLQKLSGGRGLEIDLAYLRNRLAQLRDSERHAEETSVQIAMILNRWRRKITDGN